MPPWDARPASRIGRGSAVRADPLPANSASRRAGAAGGVFLGVVVPLDDRDVGRRAQRPRRLADQASSRD